MTNYDIQMSLTKKNDKLDKKPMNNEIGTAGQWAQGLSKGVFAIKRSRSTGPKGYKKSPAKKTSR